MRLANRRLFTRNLHRSNPSPVLLLHGVSTRNKTSPMKATHRLARGLGWFSVCLGLAEIISGRELDRYLGTGRRQGILRLFGLRELGAGAVILAQREPNAASVWSRVGGDVMDLIFLGTALEHQGNKTRLERLTVATTTVAAITALDIYCAWQLGRTPKTSEEESVQVGRAEANSTINGTPEELYALWRDPETLTQVMGHFATVAAKSEDHAEWTVHGPAGTTLQWESQIVQEEPGQFLRWYSLQGAKIPNGGSIKFAPAVGGRGTVATLSVDFNPPGGVFGKAAAKAVGMVPHALAIQALQRFKRLAEKGGVAAS